MSPSTPAAVDVTPPNAAGADTPDGRVAFYDTSDQARTAVKLLINNGFSSEQIYVLCSDEKRHEEFRSRLMPAGAPQLNTATSVVGAAGAAIGMGVAGGAGLIVGWPIAAVGATIGAAVGGTIGALLGAGTYSDEETNRLMEAYDAQVQAGAVVVIVAPREGDGADRMQTAGDLLAAAVDPV